MKLNQFGRSMVEMLGVLAIIGVLSVGAIAGYSNAMLKFKTNKQASQIDLLFSVVYRHIEDIKKNGYGFSWIPVFIQKGEFPEDMYTSKTSTQIRDVFKSQYTLTYHDTGYIALFSYLNKGEYSQIACENIYNIAKQWHTELRSVAINNSSGSYASSYSGAKYCTGQNKCLKNLTMSEISGICNVCEEDKLCYLFIRFI